MKPGDAVAQRYLDVSLRDQRLKLVERGRALRTYVVSTAANGAGERMGSQSTPRGWHRIRAKIGAGLPLNSVFVARRPTGELYSEALRARFPERDWILTRILWLSGLEPGWNRFGEVDSARRFIYIHGSPDEGVNGRRNSHGCIRMKNGDMLELFDLVEVGCRVRIR